MLIHRFGYDRGFSVLKHRTIQQESSILVQMELGVEKIARKTFKIWSYLKLRY